jgi:hypothetical protein
MQSVSSRALLLTLLSGVVLLHADESSLDTRISALEKNTTPTGHPEVKNGVDLFLFGDLLYWNARVNGLNTAVVQNNTAVTRFIRLNDSHITTLHGDWNWGFRVGCGYNMEHDSWDLKLTWLRFTDHGHSHIGSGENVAIYPTPVMPFAPVFDENNQFASAMRASWHLNLNQLDLELGREFFASSWLTLRPHGGIRSNWVKQSMRDFYAVLNTFPSTDTTVTFKDHWWGIGLAGGIDSQWGLGGGWSLFGNLGAAILYGFHPLTNTHIDNPTESPSDTTLFAHVDNSYHIAQPILDLQAGLAWDHLLFKDHLHLGLQLGWEQHIYFSQSRFPTFTGFHQEGNFVSNPGDLTLQGWMASLRVDF